MTTCITKVCTFRWVLLPLLIRPTANNLSAGEGNFNDGDAANRASGTATPLGAGDATPVSGKGGKKTKGMSKKAKTAAQKLAIIDGTA